MKGSSKTRYAPVKDEQPAFKTKINESMVSLSRDSSAQDLRNDSGEQLDGNDSN